MSDIGTVWFPSKIDWWLRILLFVAPGATLFTLSAALASGDSEEILVGTGSVVFVIGLYALVVIPVRYGIGTNDLTIRFGIMRQRIKLAEIQEVSPTNNLLSSPALSLDRLAIRTGPGLLSQTMISPDDREKFLSMLATNAGMRQEGDRLVR